MITNEDAMNSRISRRKYEKAPIASDKVRQLMRLIDDYKLCSGLSIHLILNNGDAFQGFRRSYGLFSGVENFFLLAGDKNDVNLKEKAGYFGECLVLESTKLGLGTCWVGGSYDKKACGGYVKDNEELVCVIAVGNAAEELSIKERIIYKLAHSRKTKTVEEMCSGDKPYSDWFLKAMRFVQKAPSAKNRQPAHFIYHEETITASVSRLQGLFLAELGIAKLHFELGAQCGYWEWGNGGRFVMDQIA
ncbi:MAG: nitroreductase family protein [Christensenellales bacterium]